MLPTSFFTDDRHHVQENWRHYHNIEEDAYRQQQSFKRENLYSSSQYLGNFSYFSPTAYDYGHQQVCLKNPIQGFPTNPSFYPYSSPTPQYHSLQWNPYLQTWGYVSIFNPTPINQYAPNQIV